MIRATGATTAVTCSTRPAGFRRSGQPLAVGAPMRSRAATLAPWRTRIVGSGDEDPTQLIADPPGTGACIRGPSETRSVSRKRACATS